MTKEAAELSETSNTKKRVQKEEKKTQIDKTTEKSKKARHDSGLGPVKSSPKKYYRLGGVIYKAWTRVLRRRCKKLFGKQEELSDTYA